MTLLAIETSCDETSAAVIRDGAILSNVVSSQTKIHAEYGGVVPELATREHLRNFLPVTQLALSDVKISATQLDAVAATQGPGLPNALFIGLKAAQSLAYSLRKPFLGIHHHEAHLYSPWISGDPPRADFENFQPSVSLIVSGGHTILVHVKSELEHQVLGSTLDDAAGECFDKIGKLMGLAYPAGPEIDRLAEQGNPKAFNFPRPMLTDPNDDFSFAGLKTSVRYFLQKNPELLGESAVAAVCDRRILPDDGHRPPLQNLHDLCASVQAAIVEVLVKKTMRAAKRVGVHCITASGGVICNRALRHELTAACAKKNFQLRLAEKKYSTDNAAMIGILAERKLLRGISPTTLDAEIEPGWAL